MKKKIKKAFADVRADEAMKTKTKELLTTRPRRFYQRPAFGVALGLILVLVVTVSVIRFNSVPVEAAYVIMEGPVGIGLSVDGDNQVLNADALSHDAGEILDRIHVAGMSCDEAMQAIMGDAQYQQIQGNEVSVSVQCENENQHHELTQTTESACQNYMKQHKNQHQNQQNQPEATETQMQDGTGNDTGAEHQGNGHGAEETGQGQSEGQHNMQDETGNGTGSGYQGNGHDAEEAGHGQSEGQHNMQGGQGNHE